MMQFALPVQKVARPVWKAIGMRATRKTIGTRDSWAMLGIALAVLLISWFPLIAFPRHPLTGYINDGNISISDDMPAYISAIRQGIQGHLFWLDQFTTAPVGRILMYPFYTISGLLLRPLHWAPEHIFVLLRLAADVALLASLWLLVSACISRHHVAAFTLCLLNSGGIGLLLLLDPNPIPFLNGSFGIMQMLLLPPPHVAIGVACEALIFVLCARRRQWHGYVALAGVFVLLGLAYPFGLPTMMGLCTAVAVGETLAQRRVTRHFVGVFAGVMLVAPIPLYYYWLFHHAPIWSRSAFLTIGAWPPLSVLAWLYVPAAALALPVAWQRSNRLLTLWVVMAIASGVVSGAQPQRMLAGVTVPLSLLAVQALARWPRLLRPAVLSLSLGALLLPFLFVGVVRVNASRIFTPEPIIHIGAYLAAHATEHDVVLADYAVSNRLVALAPVRVIAGHGSQTVDYASAAPVTRGYYTWPRERRISAENRYHVTYIVVSTRAYHRLVSQMNGDRRYALVYTIGAYDVFYRAIRP